MLLTICQKSTNISLLVKLIIPTYIYLLFYYSYIIHLIISYSIMLVYSVMSIYVFLCYFALQVFKSNLLVQCLFFTNGHRLMLMIINYIGFVLLMFR